MQLVLDIYLIIANNVVMLYKGHNVHNKKVYQKNNNEWLDTLAQKIAEVRLSELGFNFIPGIAPYFRRFRKSIEARAYIVKRVSLISDEGNIKRKT